MKSRVSILVWKGNVYIPTMAPFEYGGWVSVDPVIITKPNFDDLIPAINEITEKNLNQLTLQTDDIKDLIDPLLHATNAKSWHQLAETGAAYLIDRDDDQIIVNITLPGKKHKFQFDNEKTEILPPDTSLENILEIILDDIHSRPELFIP